MLAVLTKYQVPEKKAVVFAALEGAWIKSLDALTALDPAAFDELADELKENDQITPRVTKAILNEGQGKQPVLRARSATEAYDARHDGGADARALTSEQAKLLERESTDTTGRDLFAKGQSRSSGPRSLL